MIEPTTERKYLCVYCTARRLISVEVAFLCTFPTIPRDALLGTGQIKMTFNRFDIDMLKDPGIALESERASEREKRTAMRTRTTHSHANKEAAFS